MQVDYWVAQRKVVQEVDVVENITLAGLVLVSGFL
jgi:hypothetical protein